jgi:hypothetical protein
MWAKIRYGVAYALARTGATLMALALRVEFGRELTFVVFESDATDPDAVARDVDAFFAQVPEGTRGDN